MKFLKTVPLITLALCSLNVHAGLFDSSDDFKCGRDDAVKAVGQYIKDKVGGQLQSTSLTAPASLYNKPLNQFVDKMNSIRISLSEVSTISNDSATQINCQAKLDIQLPPEALNVMREIPGKLNAVTPGNGELNNNAIVWRKYNYRIKLADNKKDISVSDSMGEQASSLLYNVVVMAVNEHEIVNSNKTGKLNDVLFEYKQEDAALNSLWKSMPDSVRASMKASQTTWIKDKAAKCGKISDATAEILPVQDRIKILTCQTEMTRERISFLGGDN